MTCYTLFSTKIIAASFLHLWCLLVKFSLTFTAICHTIYLPISNFVDLKRLSHAPPDNWFKFFLARVGSNQIG